MGWNIKMYETPNGRKPIDEFIESQERKTQSKIIHLIKLLEKYGTHIGMPYSKRLNRSLSELRIRGDEMRILYGFKDQTILIVHIFKKKTNKVPKKEIETALRRYCSCV